MSTLAEIIAEGKRLEAAATPGPWAVRNGYKGSGDEDRVWGVFAGNVPVDEDGEPEWWDTVRIIETDTGVYPPKTPDASLIAFARNNLPRLLAVAEAAVEMRDEFASNMVFEYNMKPHEIQSIKAFDAAADGVPR